MSRNVFIAMLIVLIGIVFMITLVPAGKTGIVRDTKHNVVVKFNGKDSEIPEDGQLLIIKCSLEDTVVVEPATLDDCRRILEENGQG